jgi:hypothetical protein
LAEVAARLGEGDDEPVLLMNGFDHMPPDPHTSAVAEALARRTGATVERGLLEAAAERGGQPFRGELTGARLANLLPGVWSARMPIKLRNRRCEALLLGWVEPWAALGRRCGAADERPSLRLAWREVLQSQAHDSLGGCALDAVAERVCVRLDDAEGLAAATLARTLGRLAGLGLERRVPWTLEQEVAVFNPSPHPRTDVVRVALDAYPAMRLTVGIPEFPPLVAAAAEPPGFAVDGRPARVVPSGDPTRTRWLPDQTPFDLEFVAAGVPAFGWRRFPVTPSPRVPDEVDEGREVEADGVWIRVAEDGTLAVRLGGAEWRGLLAIEDRGDRGDTYDFDPVGDDPGAVLESVSWRRRRHPRPAALEVTRVLGGAGGAIPAASTAPASASASPCGPRRAPPPACTDRPARACADNTACDHRLRLLFPDRAAGGHSMPPRPSTSRSARRSAPMSRAGCRAGDLRAPGLGRRGWAHGRGARPP